MGERRFCYRCMEKYDMEQHICPHCGFDDTTPHNPMYITPGTVLHDRYMVGIMLNYNGEGASYVGHDISTGCKIMLREYMPANFCTRVKNKATISVNYNNLAKYKAFMVEYTELNKSLAQLRNNSNINPVLDMFAENNTTYTVFEYLDGEKMLDYLKDNAGELSWEQVAKLFPPLFTTIGILHNAGIIHRAISPDTVYINSKGELKLSGFCVSAVRTAEAGLEYELFKGYAAPEQYSASSSSRQGSWTDVYSVCALLYRALTGCMPVDSMSRMKNDDLCEPAMLNKSIPSHVSKVIMDGMNLNGSERIQTITELVTRLFEQPVTPKTVPAEPPSTAPQPPPANHNLYTMPPEVQAYQQQYSQQRPEYHENREQRYSQQQSRQNHDSRRQRDDYDDYHYEKVSTIDRLKVPVIITILLLAILVIISVFIMRVFVPANSGSESSSRNSSSLSENIVTDSLSDESTTEEVIPDTEMPNLVGKFYEFAEKKYKDYFQFEVTFEYDDVHEIDMITAQDIDAGTQVVQGCVVNITVSQGKEKADIPSYSGLTVSQYENELKKAGISSYSFIVSSNTWGYPDTITQLQVDGKEVYAGQNFSNKDSKLIVYYIPKDAEIQAPQTDYNNQTYYTTAAAISTVNPNYVTTAVAPPVTTPPVVTDPPPVVTDPPPVVTSPLVVTDPPPIVTDPPPVVIDPPPVVTDDVSEW